MGSLGDTVLLERAVDSVATQQSFGAEGLIASLAEITGQAGTVEPLGEEVSFHSHHDSLDVILP